MDRFSKLNSKVLLWAKQKGILDKATPEKQSEKTLEEVQELIDAIKNNNREEVIDALGDITVTILIQAHMQELDLLDCLEKAYEVISKRTGKMVDGKFVKDK